MELPDRPDEYAAWILAKISVNESPLIGTDKLTSFSVSRDVALSYAGIRGWLLEIEVKQAEILFAEPYLERVKNAMIPTDKDYARADEAHEMAGKDQEVFLMAGASTELVRAWLVGGLER